MGKNREIKYPRKFSLPIKGLVNTSRTPGKRQLKCSEISTFQNREIKMQQKYNVLQYIYCLKKKEGEIAVLRELFGLEPLAC